MKFSPRNKTGVFIISYPKLFFDTLLLAKNYKEIYVILNFSKQHSKKLITTCKKLLKEKYPSINFIELNLNFCFSTNRKESIKEANLRLEELKRVIYFKKTDIFCNPNGCPISLIISSEVKIFIVQHEAIEILNHFFPIIRKFYNFYKYRLPYKGAYGVVGCIVPWNYPLLLMAWKVAPALSAGNTVVVKPSEITPLSILHWVDVACDHLPEGILNIITGAGETGAALVEHPDTRVIAFTGSVETGKKIALMAAKQLKKTSLELGGNDPIIICDDVDIEIAAKGTAWGGLLNAGQVCTSLERVFVMESVADAFTEAVVEEARQVRLGDPMNGQTDMGPMASEMQLEKAESKVNTAKDEGARLLCGGGRPEQFEKGYFYSPTVFDQVTSEMEMMNVETFGPIIPIQKIKTLEEAIELTNNSQYGLGCNIYTNDMEKALTAADDIKAGSFWINDPLTDNEAAPFGGMKMSGGGRELGIEGLDEFRESKHILIDYQIRKKDYWFPYDLDEGRKT